VGVVFGSPDVTSGGNALKFYASIRLEIKRTGQVKGKGENEVIGNLIRVKVSKNKMAPPFRVADFEMTYGKGVSVSGEVVDLGLASGILEKSGAWYAFKCSDAVAAVNAALAKSGGIKPVEVEEQQTPPPTTGKFLAKGLGKGVKKVSPAVAKVEGGNEGGGSEGCVSLDAVALSNTETVQLGQPFAQGRDKAKSWFEARPAVLEVTAASVKDALKKGGLVGKVANAPGALAAVGLAVSPLPGVASLQDELGALGVESS